MGRIKIKDLPMDVEISEEEMKKMTGGGLVFGGFGYSCAPTLYSAKFSIGETFRGGCSSCYVCSTACG